MGEDVCVTDPPYLPLEWILIIQLHVFALYRRWRRRRGLAHNPPFRPDGAVLQDTYFEWHPAGKGSPTLDRDVTNGCPPLGSQGVVLPAAKCPHQMRTYRDTAQQDKLIING